MYAPVHAAFIEGWFLLEGLLDWNVHSFFIRILNFFLSHNIFKLY